MSDHSSWCSSVNCSNSKQKRPDLSFFRFPKDIERCKKWVINTRRADLQGKKPLELYKSYYLCGEHFEENQFMNKDSRNKLVWNSVPTIFPIQNPPASVTPKRQPPKDRSEPPIKRRKIKNISVDAPIDPTPCDIEISTSTKPQITPKKKALIQKLRNLRSSNSKLQKKLTQQTDFTKCQSKREINTILETSKKYMSPEAVKFFHTQLRLGARRTKGFRWTKFDKEFALNLYFHGPKAYRLMRKTFKLPTVKTLRNWLRAINIQTGFNESVFHFLKEQAKVMTEQNRMCILTIDEMSLKMSLQYEVSTDKIHGFEDYGFLGTSKRTANHVLVFMIKGLFKNWKQPLAFFFCSNLTPKDILKDLTIQCIEKLQLSGIVIKGIVCDQGSNNRGMLKLLGVTVDKPYFNVGNETVYAFFDPPHLLKSIRNNLKKHDIILEDKIISWNIIRKFQEEDTKLQVRLAPKITKKHLNLPGFSSMNVKLATQIFSHSVYVGITTQIVLGKLPSEAAATASFVLTLDKLFNCFNSGTVKDSNIYKCAIKQGSPHINFLNECLHFFSKLVVTGISTPPCISGWRQSITALLLLWNDLERKNVSFLLTNRLNQDCLENLFSIVRSKGGNRDNPNTFEFKHCLKQLILNKLLDVAITDGSNCSASTDYFLNTAPNTKGPELFIAPVSVSSFNQEVLQTSICDITLDLTYLNILTYISGYILKKIRLLHKCNCVNNMLKRDKILNSKAETFCFFKGYDEGFGGLTMPSNECVQFISGCEAVFLKIFPSIFHLDKLTQRLQWKMMETEEYKNAGLNGYCHELLQMMTLLFIKIRIHHEIKLMNREFLNSKPKANRKLQKITHSCIPSTSN